MAVAVVQDYEVATLDEYDETVAARDFTPGGPGPSGLLFHWATAKGDGVRVVEVWETEDAYEAEKSAHGSIGPLRDPVAAVIPVHSILTAGALT
jgi:hypothetical protein